MADALATAAVGYSPTTLVGRSVDVVVPPGAGVRQAPYASAADDPRGTKRAGA